MKSIIFLWYKVWQVPPKVKLFLSLGAELIRVSRKKDHIDSIFPNTVVSGGRNYL